MVTGRVIGGWRGVAVDTELVKVLELVEGFGQRTCVIRVSFCVSPCSGSGGSSSLFDGSYTAP